MDFSALHYIFRPSGIPGSYTLLMLHAAGGNEYELLPLKDYFGSGLNLLGVRGNADQHGKTCFFTQRESGEPDESDLEFRTYELIHFLKRAAIAENFNVTKVIALGYSNGATIAASMLSLCPGFLSGAILLRPEKPYRERETLASKSHTPVFISSGAAGRIPKRYAQALASAGFSVEYRQVAPSRTLHQQDLALSSRWFSAHFDTTHHFI